RRDCPSIGEIGQPGSKIYVTTPPAPACGTPTIDSVRSLCPTQIEVWMHGSSSNQYQVYIQRLTPTIAGGVSYGLTGNGTSAYFTANLGSAGQSYLIAVSANCGGGVYSYLKVWPNLLTVKPLCTSLTNLIVSHPT